MPAVAPVKICHGGEIHRFTWDIEANGFNALHARFSETFPHLASNAFTVQYTDPHGDVVTVANDAEYRAAYELFRTPGGELGLVRFTATTRAATAAFHEQVADPILKAIEKLVATLNAAMEKVKHEDWQARAQSGVDVTHDAFQTAAHDARESLRAARASLRDIPFDQLLKDTTDGLKVAADGISVFAHELVTELQSEQRVQVAADRFKAAAESVAAFAKDAVDELKLSAAGAAMMASVPTPMAAMATAEVAPVAEVVAPVAEVAPVVEDVAVDAPAPVPSSSSSADSDWEQVAEPLAVAEEAVVASPAMEMPVVVVAAPAVTELSADERQWATELALIRSILSDVDTHAAIEQLAQANGNVEVVLNALMEAM